MALAPQPGPRVPLSGRLSAQPGCGAEDSCPVGLMLCCSCPHGRWELVTSGQQQPAASRTDRTTRILSMVPPDPHMGGSSSPEAGRWPWEEHHCGLVVHQTPQAWLSALLGAACRALPTPTRPKKHKDGSRGCLSSSLFLYNTLSHPPCLHSKQAMHPQPPMVPLPLHGALASPSMSRARSFPTRPAGVRAVRGAGQPPGTLHVPPPWTRVGGKGLRE